MSVTVISPPANPQTLKDLESVVAQSSPTASIRKGLTEALRVLASGLPIRIESISKLLTTSQAAEILNVSRTTMVKLLEDGKIPYEQPNVHRMVRLDDILAYKEQRTAKRRVFLSEFTQEALADGTFFTTADQADTAFEQVERDQQ